MIRRFFVLGVVALSGGCGSTDPLDPALESVHFPPGAVFLYEWTLQQGDSASLELVAQDTIVLTVAAVGETIGELTELTRLDAYTTETPTEVHSVWYQTTPARLVDVAYRGAGKTPVVHPRLGGVTAGGRGVQLQTSPVFVPLLAQLRSVQEAAFDSVQVRSDPRIVYEFPLTLGRSWVSFQNPFLQTRTVEALTDIDVGGVRLAAVIRTSLPALVPNLEWRDYVTEEGLVRRSLDQWFLVTGPDSPEPVDSARVVERLELLQSGGF